MTRHEQPRRAQAAPAGRSRRRGGYEPERYPSTYDQSAYDETVAWEAPPAPRRRRRRRRSVGRTLALILLLVLVPLVVVVGLLGMRAAAFNDRVSTAPFLSSALFGPLNGRDRVNVLLIGYGGGDHQGAFLADSINILSIDPATDTTTSVPIPRDLWLEGLPQLPANGKINEAFAAGEQAGGIDRGGQVLAEALSAATGLGIEHWMAIDFRGFEEMVDAVGGVTIDNPTAFSYTQNEQLHRAGDWSAGSFAAGPIELDGPLALAYARARYTSVQAESSDFARLARQTRIIGGLKTKVGSGGLASIGPGLGLMDALEGRLRTNLSAIDLFLLSGHLTSDRRVDLTDETVLQATTNTIGQYILIPVGWTGPGAYGALQEYVATELARPIATQDPADPVAP